jgi:hypothetical protein
MIPAQFLMHLRGLQAEKAVRHSPAQKAPWSAAACCRLQMPTIAAIQSREQSGAKKAVDIRQINCAL